MARQTIHSRTTVAGQRAYRVRGPPWPAWPRPTRTRVALARRIWRPCRRQLELGRRCAARCEPFRPWWRPVRFWARREEDPSRQQRSSHRGVSTCAAIPPGWHAQIGHLVTHVRPSCPYPASLAEFPVQVYLHGTAHNRLCRTCGRPDRRSDVSGSVETSAVRRSERPRTPLSSGEHRPRTGRGRPRSG